MQKQCETWDSVCAAPYSVKWNLNLAISECKCVVQHFGARNPNISYSLNGSLLSNSRLVRDLGVHMASNLSFGNHITEITKRARAKVNVLFKALRSNSPALLTAAFSTYIRPLLETSSSVWSPEAVGLTNLIEDVQRQFTRRLFYRCNMPPEPYLGRLRYLSIQTLEYRRCLSDFKFMYNCIHRPYELDSTCLFRHPIQNRPSHCSHRLRVALPFILRNSMSTVFSRHYSIWNNFPDNIVFALPEMFYSYLSQTDERSLLPLSKIRL